MSHFSPLLPLAIVDSITFKYLNFIHIESVRFQPAEKSKEQRPSNKAHLWVDIRSPLGPFLRTVLRYGFDASRTTTNLSEILYKVRRERATRDLREIAFQDHWVMKNEMGIWRGFEECKGCTLSCMRWAMRPGCIIMSKWAPVKLCGDSIV